MRYFPASSVKPNPTVFSSNELTDDFLGDYILQPLGWKPIEQPIMYVPFNFSKDEQGRVTVRLKTAAEDAEPATIIESDIMTLNGPIHIVDRLFIPKDF